MAVLNIGTYPPRQCGIATFSMDLRNSLLLHGNDVKIMAISDEKQKYKYPNEVMYELDQYRKTAYIQAAAAINASSEIELVIIQHEYGIYGGNEGEYLLTLVNLLKKPYLLVTHTVLRQPSRKRRDVLHALAQSASAIVCMTEQSANLMKTRYGAPAELIHYIAHGVPEFKREDTDILKNNFGYQGRQVITTFGLIGPGKGLELGIEAVAKLAHNHPDVIYLILGRTHPELLKREGERYRHMLEDQVRNLGIEDNVRFVNQYLSDEELGQYLYMTDIYLSPYPGMEQAVSGTMAFAVGCGRAIVSTPYSYAVEALANDRGLLAKSTEPSELALQMEKIIQSPTLKNTLQKKAYELGKTWTWPNVGKQYTKLFNSILTTLDETDLEVSNTSYERLQTFS